MKIKETFFSTKFSLNCKGRLIDLSSPKIMGILNVTPDSFFDGGKYQSEKAIFKQVEQMLQEGADFIDVGGMSTRPGAKMISEKEELKRVIPVISLLNKKFPGALISVDTFRAKVAREAVNNGAVIVNDISGGNFDKKLIPTVAEMKVPYILMHLQGTPQTMQKNPHFKNVVTEVMDFFVEKIDKCKQAGIKDIIIDVGFGFGKNLEHNYTLLKNLDYFKILNLPILVGISRKSMICKVLKVNSENALNGTTVLHTIALLKGAKILRVHDVKEAREAIELCRIANS